MLRGENETARASAFNGPSLTVRALLQQQVWRQYTELTQEDSLERVARYQMRMEGER